MKTFWQTLQKPISILAPMADVTDCVFREIMCSTAKPDVFFTEFVSIDALFSKGQKSMERKLRYTLNQKPIVAQVWGTDPDLFARVAQRIKLLSFDGIDINMGCPDRAVRKKGAGSALIGENNKVKQIVSAIKIQTPNLAVSIKTRLAPTQKESSDWFSFLLSLDIAALTIHGRTAEELSKVPANWDEIARVTKLKKQSGANIAIIGNGDVKSQKEINEKHVKYGVDGVMVGRGIFNNPWLFEKTSTEKGHTTDDYLDLLVKHTTLFHKTWGNSKNFEIMKKFFKVYVKNFRGANQLRQKLMSIKSFDEFESIDLTKPKHLTSFKKQLR